MTMEQGSGWDETRRDRLGTSVTLRDAGPDLHTTNVDGHGTGAREESKDQRQERQGRRARVQD